MSDGVQEAHSSYFLTCELRGRLVMSPFIGATRATLGKNECPNTAECWVARGGRCSGLIEGYEESHKLGVVLSTVVVKAKRKAA